MAPQTGVPVHDVDPVDGWNSWRFDQYSAHRRLVSVSVGAHGDAGLERLAAQPGEHVLDIGCGFGVTTLQISRAVGHTGSVLGIDLSERFIAAARAAAEAADAPAGNVQFEVADVGQVRFAQRFDCAFSCFGTMFFADPPTALRNVRLALAPGGRLVMLVWRRLEDNPWLSVPQGIVEESLSAPEPPARPDAYVSMADADLVTDMLRAAGFATVRLERCDRQLLMGYDLSEAVDVVMTLSSSGARLLALPCDQASSVQPLVRSALERGLREFVNADGTVSAMASAWIISAVSPC